MASEGGLCGLWPCHPEAKLCFPSLHPQVSAILPACLPWPLGVESDTMLIGKCFAGCNVLPKLPKAAVCPRDQEQMNGFFLQAKEGFRTKPRNLCLTAEESILIIPLIPFVHEAKLYNKGIILCTHS